jgi:hypothetical protein
MLRAAIFHRCNKEIGKDMVISSLDQKRRISLLPLATSLESLSRSLSMIPHYTALTTFRIAGFDFGDETERIALTFKARGNSNVRLLAHQVIDALNLSLALLPWRKLCSNCKQQELS